MHNHHKPNNARAHAPHILIADDSADDAEIIQLAFRDADVAARLDFVSSGEDVLSYLRQSLAESAHKPASEVPDLLLLDLKMPGMDGFQVLEWLKDHPPFDSIPTIVFSGSDQPVDINRALALGAVRYLVKPQKMQDMVQLVRGIEKFWQKLNADSASRHCVQS